MKRGALILLVLLAAAGCTGAPRPAVTPSPELREVAHRDLLEAIRSPQRVRVVPWGKR